MSKKKRKFRAMTYKEHCKSLCLICENCIFAPNWADKYYKNICPIWNKSSNDFDKPCKLPKRYERKRSKTKCTNIQK